MNNEKTIKQLADEIGVSKQAVWQKIKRQSSTDLHQLMIKKGNTVYVELKGQEIIKAMFYEDDNTKRKHIDDKKNVNVDTSVEEIELKSSENEFSFSDEQEENQEVKKENSFTEKNVLETSDKKNFWTRWFKR